MQLSPLRVALLGLLALPVLPLAQCTSNGPPDTVTYSIGPSGGSLASADYVIEITVPPNALTTTQAFTITQVGIDDGGVPGAFGYTIWSCLPSADGTCTAGPANPEAGVGIFSVPAIISYTEQAIPAAGFYDWSDYRIATYATADAGPDGAATSGWVPLANQSSNTVAGTLEGTTLALAAGPYSVVIPPSSPSDVCVSDGGLSEPGAPDDGGCSPAPLVPGKCTAFAGSVTRDCSLHGGDINVQCCYPGTPVCFTQPIGCAGACAQLPGSTVQSCDNGTGVDSVPQSTCCFPPGTQVHCAVTTVASCDAGASVCGAGAWQMACNDGVGATCCELVTSVALDAGSDANTMADANSGADTGADAGTETDAMPGVDANTDAAPDANATPDAHAAGDANGAADANPSDDAGVDGG